MHLYWMFSFIYSTMIKSAYNNFISEKRINFFYNNYHNWFSKNKCKILEFWLKNENKWTVGLKSRLLYLYIYILDSINFFCFFATFIFYIDKKIIFLFLVGSKDHPQPQIPETWEIKVLFSFLAIFRSALFWRRFVIEDLFQKSVEATF